MGNEIDLLANYPKQNRDLKTRASEKTVEVREIARKFGREFFDGERRYGYGGFSYHPRFWKEVVNDFIEHYCLSERIRILDVGCAKGFMLFDFQEALPNAELYGIDISEYAILNAKEGLTARLDIGNAKKLPYEDAFFNLVISINTVHNLDIEDCKEALREIERVSSGHSFVTVDAFRNEEERERMYSWNLTARTILSVQEWKVLFREVGYTGDYYWFIP